MGYSLSLPNAGNSYNARNVNTDGTLNNNNAYNGNNGVRPALIEHCNGLGLLRPKLEDYHSKERISCPDGVNTEHRYRDFSLLTSRLYTATTFEFEKMYQCYLKARRGKRDKTTTIKFETNAMEEVYSLTAELNNGSYTMGKYHKFTVFEPKERLILALPFRDRVVQHYICDYFFEPPMEKHFIYDTYACRKGKGAHAGLDRLQYFMQRHYRQHGCDGWVLKCDISKFFYSIDHDVLKTMLYKLTKGSGIEWLLEQIIDSTENPGIPLGNQTSQWMANLYLSYLDHFVKEKLQVKHYIRYMDDFLLIHPDKEYLRLCRSEIQQYVENELKLKLNNKTHIFPLRNGVDFLGFHTYLTETGKVIRKLRQASKHRIGCKLKKFKKMYGEGSISKEAIDQSFQSWLGQASHGNCYRLTQKMKGKYYEIFERGNKCHKR
jgi:retron-type reverse transcriptase